ncbi:uncharacterized protein LOC116843349 [Odontomachus brunneus]|uniref:uncharacterized protein LOC116843349 n=1 Tax=Odontomachus brunneus TaxID=486640 RepID=UPI0013F18145|nr:uncharacterized protein LOC116843349 [Odontomachus brunneus]XP_032669607.1 uncharacterized protein LOC116843349 [Odontomachus brunneus]XP_032669608.1 uncharacterized protein LOC116843349 [Odontomachus brunneus]XP_032669609.1 uncharacterized protein LOC116843349 [Odontomachus brunneus]XP_032669610.1 uncharacterized protein LOC116843349 [Odontomachus brunneus]XP_032669611.1 uncharacterized protein LOC116843349 [Odontomachus brunneus]XP_032669612.1 uncharacterized protein LOC116843349 [Odonto
MADESQQRPQPTAKSHKILSHLPIAIKVLEVIVAIFAIGLAVDPMNSFQRIFNKPRFKLDDAATIYITVAGYILINTLFILGHMLGDRVPKRTLLMFASVGALMHVVAGSLMVHNWRNLNGRYFYAHNNEIHPSKQYMDMLISAAVFTFVNAVVFIAEIIAILRYS